MLSRKRTAQEDICEESMKRTPPPQDFQRYPMPMNPMYHSTPHMGIPNGMFNPMFSNAYISPIGSSFSSGNNISAEDSGIMTNCSSVGNESIDQIHLFPSFNCDEEVKMVCSMQENQQNYQGSQLLNEEPHSHHEDDPSSLSKNNDKFCEVPGRLSLMGNGGKYNVTTAEIRRRLAAPECLNSSVLSAILRKAKVADNGQSMRGQLAAAGIILPVGKRKQSVTTACTALLEEEARHLAEDVDKLTRTYYPFQEIQNQLLSDAAQNGIDVEEQRQELMASLRFISKLSHLVRTVDCPIGRYTPQRTFPNEALQRDMDNYSALTHGFGILNQRSWVAVVEHLIKRMLVSLPGQAQPHFPIPPPTHYEQMGYVPNFHMQ